MGNPLSPVVTNNYTKHFETLAIESARLKPATCLWYADDIFVITQVKQVVRERIIKKNMHIRTRKR